MRELKFRAWDKKNKCWYETELKFYGFHLFGECTLICPPRAEDLQHLEVDQYTGLHDKNGVETYELDIILSENMFVVGVPLIVEYVDGCFRGVMPDKESEHEVRGLKNLTDQPFEVIGNIHQHPDLIRKG